MLLNESFFFPKRSLLLEFPHIYSVHFQRGERERMVSLRGQRWHHPKVMFAGKNNNKKKVCLHFCMW